MEIKKQTNILITPETHLRLKVNAAMLGLTHGDTIAFLVEQVFPHRNIEDALCFKQNISNQAA
jgi:hypothetical protein